MAASRHPRHVLDFYFPFLTPSLRPPFKGSILEQWAKL